MSLKALKKGLLALPLMVPAMAAAAVYFFDPLDTASVPKLLSQTGIYADISTRQLDTALKYFEVNSALWSDAAKKDRWIILPAGQKIPYNDTTDVFEYPDGTIFVKLFSHDTIPGDPTSRILWETRLLVKKTHGDNLWHGFSYKWNAAGTEAHLVSLKDGYDTVLYVQENRRYRKWHFPSQGACYACHLQDKSARGVLGFLPPQLKRKAPSNNSINQVTHLFNVGVFSGSQPTGDTLGRRWRGISEGIPSGLTEDQRFRVLDTMARAYIAANCSGCHGTKGIENGAIGHAPYLNYDFHTFTPRIEFGMPGNTGPQSLDLKDDAYDLPGVPFGRARMLQTLSEWGVSHGNGGDFDMKRPPGTRNPGFISSGYPSYSTGLFRQVARRTPRFDSLALRVRFDNEGDAFGWSAWIFKAPWGSQAWLDTLKGRNVSLMTVLGQGESSVYTAFSVGGEMMPPLATYIPDTAALRVLAEWAKNYRTLVKVGDADSITPSAIARPFAARSGPMPVIRNGMLIAPEGWTGKAMMVSLTGRSYALPSVGRGRYALPAGSPSGVYIFRIGDRSFRTSVVR